MTNRSPFGRLLREFRRQAGLSQEALAERALMSVDTISTLERGMSQAPQRETIASLERALDLESEQRKALEALAVRTSRPRTFAEDRRQSHNLPPALSQLYGREGEIDAVKALIAHEPLVTLTGAGGVGKTRLAQEVGRALLDDFVDGVWFADLAPISDPALAAKAVATLFGVRESADRTVNQLLANALRVKHMLLIVDNCEHLVEPVADLVQALIQECPNLRILASSRQSLNVLNEQIFRVGSLGVEPATALFAEHARRVSESFALTDEDVEVVRRIVRALDGIPLAIELAAARLKLLSLNQLAERLSQRLRLLTGGSRTKLPRQQTMRATIDWSYDLLDSEERKIFRRLAVFAGGFSLDAASVICADADAGDWGILELLGSLVDKSLVISEPAGAEKRYRLLESMRTYALEKSQNDAETANRRHAEYYADLAERAQASLGAAPSPAEWARSLEPEVENFSAALDWAFGEGGDALVGSRVLTALQELWIERGLAIDAARRAQRVLVTHQTLPLHLRAALWLTLTRCENEFQMAPRVVLEAAAQARDLCEALGDRRALATALRVQGIARVRLGALSEAQSDLQRSLDLFREIGDLREVARALGSLGLLFQTRGDFALARTTTLEALQLACDIGDERGSTLATMNIAETEFALGEIESAVARASSNLVHHDVQSEGSEFRAAQESNLAAYLVALGRYDEARSTAFASIAHSDSNYMAIPLQHFSAVLAPKHPKRAARLLGYVEKVFALTPFSRQITEKFTYDVLMSELRKTMEDDEIATLGREGAAMTEDQVLALALREPGHAD